MSDGLYWYPAINNKYLFDGDYNKGQMVVFLHSVFPCPLAVHVQV